MPELLPGNIAYGGDVTFRSSDAYRSLGHFILYKLKAYGDTVTLIQGATGVEYTSRQIYDATVRCAYVLEHLGVRAGDVIALSSENSFEFAIVMYAAFALNAVVAPMNVTYNSNEIQHAIRLAKPKFICCSRRSIEGVSKVAKQHDFVKKLIVFDVAATTPNTLSLDKLITDPRIPSKGYYDVQPVNKKEDVAVIMYSSGTTGLPKGVLLTHSNLFTYLDPSMESIPLLGVPLLGVNPWSHLYGCTVLIVAALKGGTLVFLPKFHDRTYLGCIQKYRVAYAYMVPPLMVFLAKSPLVDEYDLSSLKLLMCGAAPLSKETEDQIRKKLNVIIIQGYGLTESTSGVTSPIIGMKPASVGILKKGVYAKVIDPDTGKILGMNERGELCFKGDGIMKGYIDNPKATQDIIRDGWLHTGDIGYFDEDFAFFIVDRIKELIKYKGYQVPPTEIESLLLTHPKVKDAAVIGKPDEEAGELPMAFVVKQEGAQLTAEEIEQFVAERESPAKKLRGGVVFIDEIPKNPGGKILRRTLKEMIKSQKSKL